MRTTLLVFLLAAAAITPTAGRAQGQDPMREIQEIARRVDEQLQEIDRLLLESSKKNQPRQAPKQMLDQARERSQTAEDGINKLIEKLNEMKGNSSSQSQQQQQQQQQQDQQNQDEQDKQKQQQRQQQQNQRNRRENQTPDFQERQRQPGQQPGQEQGQPQQGQQQPGQQQPGQQPQPGEGQPQPQGDGQPQGGQENPDGGKNTRGNRQPEPQTGPGNPGTGDGSWGELQPYLNFLKNRGSRPPDVPEKFRKYWEAYLKRQQGAGGSSGGK